ncbi:MAG TPA: CHRD domain-containing protein [Actinomycetota bacterium]|nr:CHRD domain-containing protein [Actinomycetota bacterium]
MRKRTLLPLSLALTGVLCLSLAAGTAFAGIEQERVRIRLLGAEEVPTNVHGNRDRGSVTVFFEEEDESEDGAEGSTTEICFRFGRLTLTEGEALPTAGHIHLKNPGQPTGGIILHIFGSGDGVAPPVSYPTAKICRQAPVELVEDISRHPERYYINLHNPTHPSGVVRGDFPEDL